MDLSNTGMGEYAIQNIGATLRRAKSLRSVHLCGNPGITNRVIDYIVKRAHCVKDDGVINVVDINKLSSDQHIPE